jgi:hypothetical protein
MAAVTYTLTGLKDLRDVFGKIPAALEGPIGKVNRDTAGAIQARARSLAPHDKGDLIRQIAAASNDGITWRVGILDTTLSRGGKNSAHQHPSVYGVWYEYGFVHRKIAAHPFMRPAAKAEETQYQQRIDRVAQQFEQKVSS